jgi:uncharacterized protein YjlB
MKLKLTDLDPHLLKQTSKVAFEHTDIVGEARGLMLQCPACFWSSRRTHSNTSHLLIIWEDPARWQFIGHDYRDLSLMAGRVTVSLMAGACHGRFYIKNGKVDFY